MTRPFPKQLLQLQTELIKKNQELLALFGTGHSDDIQVVRNDIEVLHQTIRQLWEEHKRKDRDHLPG